MQITSELRWYFSSNYICFVDFLGASASLSLKKISFIILSLKHLKQQILDLIHVRVDKFKARGVESPSMVLALTDSNSAACILIWKDIVWKHWVICTVWTAKIQGTIHAKKANL